MNFETILWHIAVHYLALYAESKGLSKLSNEHYDEVTGDIVKAILSPEANRVLTEHTRRDDVILKPFSTRALVREILRRFKLQVCCDGDLTEFDETLFDMMVRQHVVRIEAETVLDPLPKQE